MLKTDGLMITDPEEDNNEGDLEYEFSLLIVKVKGDKLPTILDLTQDEELHLMVINYLANKMKGSSDGS